MAGQKESVTAGRTKAVQTRREAIKQQTLQTRRLQHRQGLQAVGA